MDEQCQVHWLFIISPISLVFPKHTLINPISEFLLILCYVLQCSLTQSNLSFISRISWNSVHHKFCGPPVKYNTTYYP